MKKKYTRADLKKLNWDEYGKLIDALVESVLLYIKEHNIRFHIIAPILRGGVIPAVAIANKLEIVPFLPIQVKYDKNWKIKRLSVTKLLSNEGVPKAPNILIVDNLTYSGDSAQKVRQTLRKIYPHAKMYFATTENVLVDEQKKQRGFEYIFAGINTPTPRKINIYPFQDLAKELKALNNH